MEYWIIVDNRHVGPYSAEQLLDAGLTADTLVWHEGLTAWVRAGEVGELAAGLERQRMADSERQAESFAEERDDVATAEAYKSDNRQADACVAEETQFVEPCPPAYIAWSVIVTVLCCTIIGIPAIIFSSMTKSAYYKGDIAKARRYSETAQWFIIASIVLGVIGVPFQMALMGLL